MLVWIFIALVSVAVAVFASVIIAFRRKVNHITGCFDAASEEALDQLYGFIEQAGNEPANSYILAKTKGAGAALDCRVAIPEGMGGFPWSGCVFQLQEGAAAPVDPESGGWFLEVADSDKQTRAGGKIYRPVASPRKRFKSGKLQNSYAPDRIYGSSKEVKEALAGLCPKYPNEFLGFVLMSAWHTHEYDGIKQARIGGSPAWIQTAAFQNCGVCKKRMVQILQVPGQMLTDRQYSEGTFYLFGCVAHPEERRTVYQST